MQTSSKQSNVVSLHGGRTLVRPVRQSTDNPAARIFVVVALVLSCWLAAVLLGAGYHWISTSIHTLVEGAARVGGAS